MVKLRKTDTLLYVKRLVLLRKLPLSPQQPLLKFSIFECGAEQLLALIKKAILDWTVSAARGYENKLFTTFRVLSFDYHPLNKFFVRPVVNLLYGQAHGLGKRQQKFRTGKYYSGLVFTLPFLNGRESLKLSPPSLPRLKSPLPSPPRKG